MRCTPFQACARGRLRSYLAGQTQWLMIEWPSRPGIALDHDFVIPSAVEGSGQRPSALAVRSRIPPLRPAFGSPPVGMTKSQLFISVVLEPAHPGGPVLGPHASGFGPGSARRTAAIPRQRPEFVEPHGAGRAIREGHIDLPAAVPGRARYNSGWGFPLASSPWRAMMGG